MTDFVVPCGTIARMAKLLTEFPPEADEWFHAIRIDGECVVASNRIVMAVEHVAGNVGIVHLIPDPVLIKQCETEAPFGSMLTITVVEALKFATAKTTLGFQHTANCAVWSDKPCDFDRWRSLIGNAQGPDAQSSGGMYWDAANIARLAAASPSGQVVFPERISTSDGRGIIIRDTEDYEWLGFFMPFPRNKPNTPATIPSWFVR